MECVAVLFVILLTIQLEVIDAQTCPSGCSCTGALIDCSGTGLTSIPTNIDPSTTNLYLAVNAISTVSSDALDGLVNLKFLDLAENDISTVSSGAFDGLIELEYIKLSNNALSTVSSGVFDGLVNLKFLLLDDNNISTVPIGAFDGLSELQALDLRNNPTQCCTMLDVIEFGKTLGFFQLDCTDFGQKVSYEEFNSSECACKDAGGICVSQKKPCNTKVLNMKCSRCFPKCCKKP